MRVIARRLIAAAFVGFIFLLLVGTWLHWDPVESRENRNLAKLPRWPRDFAEAKAYSDQLLTYFRDHFAFRNTMIRGVAIGSYHGVGQRNANRIIVGKEGWLFYASDENYLADRGLDPFSESDLDAWEALLERRDQYFRDRGIALVVVIPPDKQTIYPEYMPEEFAHPPRASRLDQLIARLKDRHSPVRLVDLRPALLAAKQERQVYFKTDSHWNDDGIYPAYMALLKGIGEAMPGYRFEPQPRSNFLVKLEEWNGDLAQQLDLYYEYREQTRRWWRRDFVGRPNAFADLPRIASTDGDPMGPRLLTYNDSFTAPMIQFLAPNFSHATYQWNAWTESIDPAAVKEAKPDVVLCEFVERKLHDPIPIDAPEIRQLKIGN